MLDAAGLRTALAQADAASGWQQLMLLWQLPAATPPRLQAGCPQGLDPEWLCFRGSGSFAKLRLFGRPVLLVLRQDDKVVPVLLTAIDREQAQLELSGSSAVVDRNVLREFWSGEYPAPNRLASGVPPPLRPGGPGGGERSRMSRW